MHIAFFLMEILQGTKYNKHFIKLDGSFLNHSFWIYFTSRAKVNSTMSSLPRGRAGPSD